MYEEVGLFADTPDNFFPETILEVIPGEAQTLLPHLSSLSLSAVSFQVATDEILHALNITRLHSLRLWNYPHSLKLLKLIVSEAHTVRLKSFELVIDVAYNKEQGIHGERHYEMISALLNAFRGLEDLYLMLADYIKWEVIAGSISGHISTLDRLILHERVVVEDDEWLTPIGSRIASNTGIHNLYESANLTCVGTCLRSHEWICVMNELLTKDHKNVKLTDLVGCGLE